MKKIYLFVSKNILIVAVVADTLSLGYLLVFTRLPWWFSVSWCTGLFILSYLAFAKPKSVSPDFERALVEEGVILGEAEDFLNQLENLASALTDADVIQKVHDIIRLGSGLLDRLTGDKVASLAIATRFRSTCERTLNIILEYQNLKTGALSVSQARMREIVGSVEGRLLNQISDKLNEMVADYDSGRVTELEVAISALEAILSLN